MLRFSNQISQNRTVYCENVRFCDIAPRLMRLKGSSSLKGSEYHSGRVYIVCCSKYWGANIYAKTSKFFLPYFALKSLATADDDYHNLAKKFVKDKTKIYFPWHFVFVLQNLIQLYAILWLLFSFAQLQLQTFD